MKKAEEKTRVRDLETVLVWAAFLVLLQLFWPARPWLPLCLSFLLAGLLLKGVTSRMVGAWLAFSRVLSRINSRVLLALVFFLCLTPLALLYRLFARNPLMLKKDERAPTYFKNRNHPFGRRDFEKMW